MRAVKAIALASGLMLSACATSSVSKFYHPSQYASATGPTNVEPEIRQGSGTASEMVLSYGVEGWTLIGYSAFNGPQASKAMLIAQAKQVGAELVVVASQYTGTQSTGAVGTTAFTRYGAFSVAVPTSVDRYSQKDLFFVKAPRVGLGILSRPLKPEEHAAIGTNKGMKVTAVVNGSPAAKADVLAGDTILSANNTAIYDPASMKAILEAAYGKTVDLEILRNDQTLHKVISLSPDGSW